MSAAYIDISYDLIEGLFTVLDGNVVYNDAAYSVYKSIPKQPDATYVWITEVMHAENGTKDDFVYEGTVQVRVIDESQARADKKKAYGIMNVVRGLIKATRTSVFSCGDNSLIIFAPGTSTELAEQADGKVIRIQLIDIYDFIVE